MSAAAAIPSPEGTTFESTVHGLRNDPVAFVTNLVGEYGDIVRLPFGEHSLYLLNHPDFVADLFLNEPPIFGKRKDAEAEQAYLNQIAGFTPLFAHSAIPGYAPMMVAAAERAAQRWAERFRSEGPFEADIYREIGRLTLEVVVETLFKASTGDVGAELMDAIVTMDVGYGFNPIEATLAGFLPPADVQISSESQAARQYIQAFVQKLADHEVASPSGSFLGMLIQYMGIEQAVGIAMSVMFAMHEVTATTLPWTFYLLSQYPDVDTKLHAEFERVLGGKAPTASDFDKLPYARMVLEEARRLYPSVWIIGRFLRQDHSFGGRLVPAGSIVMASQRVMHVDARFFPEPERFDPERWTVGSRTARPQYSYFPFSAGPRACAGEEFAELQDVLVLGVLLAQWKAALIPGQRLEPVPQKSDAPRHGIRMRLERR